MVTQAVCEFLAPIQERRAAVAPEDVRRVVCRGTGTANDVAESTLHEVRAAMGMTYQHIAGHEAAACVTVDG